MTEIEVANALSFPKNLKKHKVLLEKLRNKGNYQHNTDGEKKGTRMIKVRRKQARTCDTKDFVQCMYCKGMFVRKDL